jgi:hypothetical protein
MAARMTQPTAELISRRAQTARLCRQQARREYTPEPVRVCLEDSALAAITDARIIKGFSAAHADN